MAIDVNNLVIVSDLHSGCRLALCPPDGVPLDDGGIYMPSPFQLKLWQLWEIFWKEFVPDATKKEPYAVVINGDAREGIHHNSTTTISNNEYDQERIAKRILEPIVAKCKGEFFMIRGTEAHVGKSAVAEERLAKDLGAKPNAEGQFARYELWKRLGPKLIHSLHHVGTVNSQAYETTSLHKELVEMFIESSRWHREAPDVIVRSHRHRHIETTLAVNGSKLPDLLKPLFDGKKPSYEQVLAAIEMSVERSETGRAYAIALPAWQGKTPYAWRAAGARNSTPQFGGVVIRWSRGELFVRSKVWTVERSPVE